MECEVFWRALCPPEAQDQASQIGQAQLQVNFLSHACRALGRLSTCPVTGQQGNSIFNRHLTIASTACDDNKHDSTVTIS